MAYLQKPGRGNNAKTGHGIPSPFKQTAVDKEVESMIANKKKQKASDDAAKSAMIRKGAEETRGRLERKIKLEATEGQAKKDSISVDSKMRKEGFNYLASTMGNKKANETRKSGSPYKDGSYQQVLDPKTNKTRKEFVINK
jgi:hypothetical protein